MEGGSQPSVGPNFVKAFVPGLIIGLLVGSLVSAFLLPMLTEKAPAPTGVKGTVVTVPTPREREPVAPADDKKMDDAKTAGESAAKATDGKPPVKPGEVKPADPSPKTPG